MSTSTKSRFITFEGIDGCGKSTQAKLLLETLNDGGCKAILVREPGGTRVSEAVREILLTKGMDELEHRTEALLMTASRAQLTDEIILPNLDKGNWVIADRFADSTLAYQGGGRSLDIEWLIKLNDFATAGLSSDMTVFVDIVPEEGQRRREANNPDRIEKAGMDFQQNVRKMYHEIAKRFPDRIFVVDGHETIENIQHNIWQEITRRYFL
ncbi:MAG: dTMP kinase [Candidatus Marinimicrobia bacterium]|jgi:dTMP kinase|nr:dTMP kinase [Candidatus Neomarinimicrobiota bacterium]MDP6229202.1 dTMP kinase [Candidatus Neomarinimicrobiota bacterium]MDP7094919.1 dTMP kinase [Candidatus Neomarinimicrobiota bacterium]MDP7166099.1 dTMP kinase [Candidatus Neomarinimicrobiota bacterium]MDP7512737.1 dTMP kinase [Candidatus Neomarinimicrobiota bacterium]|tara:strand:+ start:2375 stop:3007 length:633 start_codon:yes stop_codon:yes gene_type:complete